MEISMYHYLFIGLITFIIGLAGSIVCKNVIKVLICIEFILTGVNINFATFAKYCGGVDADGFVMVLFYTGIGAVELAVALYIFYFMYAKKQSDNIEKYGDL
jgi:NADH:ubiquinone oxidoreductase subunit K